MNKSLAPLIVFMSFIVLITIILINFRTPPKQIDDLQHQPFLSMEFSEDKKPAALKKSSEEHIPQTDNTPDLEKMMRDVMKDLSCGKEDEAEDKLKTILVFDPVNINALSLLGNILYASKRYAEAELLFRKQEKLKPDDATIYNSLGSILAKQKKYDEAISAILKALELDPDSPVANINLAGIYSASGDIERALFHFRKAYERIGEKIIPLSYDPVLDNIRYEYEFQNIIDEARETIKKKREAAVNGEIYPNIQQPLAKPENEQD